MRKLQNFFFLVALAAAVFGMIPKAEAGLISAPMALRGIIHYIKFDGPTLPPMAFTQFCLRYAEECKPHRIAFRGGRLKMNAERWADLRAVNRDVNAAIRPEANLEGLAGEKWLLHPISGDCNDYAVTKRHELLARGWPARALLLSEVVTRGGEHHLVLVIRGPRARQSERADRAMVQGAVSMGPDPDAGQLQIVERDRRPRCLSGSLDPAADGL
jgi:predicted transglutaminase-like cysteine proteinase